MRLGEGSWRFGWIEWAIALPTGQQRDTFYKDRWGQSGHPNTKTKRQIDCMALSSGGQLWFKQTRQMRHNTTSKHELIVTEVTPKKKKLWHEANKVECPSNVCQIFIIQHFVWQWKDVTDICDLKVDSIPAAPSRHQQAESAGGIFFLQHDQWVHS